MVLTGILLRGILNLSANGSRDGKNLVGEILIHCDSTLVCRSIVRPATHMLLGEFEIGFPTLRELAVGNDRLDRTLRLASTAIDALVSIDDHVSGSVGVVRVLAHCVDAVNGADLETTAISQPYTRLTDYVGHSASTPSSSIGLMASAHEYAGPCISVGMVTPQNGTCIWS
jgi:hypothetical protein